MVEKFPYVDVSLSDFKALIDPTPGWKFVGNIDYKYHIREGFSNVDEYVKEALYHHDEPMYESLRGYTKVPRLGRALHSLLKYSGPTVYKDQLFDDKMNDIYEASLLSHSYSFDRVGIFSPEMATLKIPTNTSAGISFPGKTKGEVLREACDNVKGMIEKWKRGEQVQQIPCKLALRGHLSEVDKVKTRCVWVSPVEHIILENMFFRGFYHQIYANENHRNLFMTGKYTIARLNTYIQDDNDRDLSFVNTDFKGYDSMRCRFVLQDVFRKVFYPKIKFEEPWQYLAFEYIVDCYIFTHLCLPDGSVYKKIGGVPSGSFLTLLINSIVTDVIISSALKYLNIFIADKRVLGDDFSYKTNKIPQDELDLQVSDLVSCVREFFSMIISPEKVIATNDKLKRKFIGYQLVDGRIFREDRDLLLTMLHPESIVPDIATSFTRMFSFMIIGGANSEYVLKFYETYLSGYYAKLKEYGPDVFQANVMRHGNLRVFKHVFKIDLEAFAGLNIDDFTRIFFAKVPYFLTMGIRFILE